LSGVVRSGFQDRVSGVQSATTNRLLRRSPFGQVREHDTSEEGAEVRREWSAVPSGGAKVSKWP